MKRVLMTPGVGQALEAGVCGENLATPRDRKKLDLGQGLDLARRAPEKNPVGPCLRAGPARRL